MDLAYHQVTTKAGVTKEKIMQRALKLDTCDCGRHLDFACSKCAQPVCPTCSHVEIVSLDTSHILVSRYCAACAQDPARNPWGGIYWEGLRSLFT
jgi:hypothetical protein